MTKVTTRSPKHTKKFWALTTFGVVLGAAIIGTVIWHYENNRAIAADRARFVQADKDVKTIAAAIKSAVPPEKESISEECTHQSREFETEPTVCRTVSESFYGVNNVNQVNDTFYRYNVALKSRQDLFKFKDVTETPMGTEQTSNPSFVQVPSPGKSEVVSEIYTDNASGLSCSLVHELYNSDSPPDYYSQYSSKINKLTLITSFDCGGSAKVAHYPLVN